MIHPSDYRAVVLLVVVILLGAIFLGAMVANTDLMKTPYKSLAPLLTLDREETLKTRVPAYEMPPETTTGPARGIYFGATEVIIIALVGIIIGLVVGIFGLVVGIFLARPTIYPGPF